MALWSPGVWWLFLKAWGLHLPPHALPYKQILTDHTHVFPRIYLRRKSAALVYHPLGLLDVFLGMIIQYDFPGIVRWNTFFSEKGKNTSSGSIKNEMFKVYCYKKMHRIILIKLSYLCSWNPVSPQKETQTGFCWWDPTPRPHNVYNLVRHKQYS